MSSSFFERTGAVLFSFTRQSFTYVEFQNFSRNLSFRVNGASSDLEARNVPLVEGQNVVPFVTTDSSCLVKDREERLRTLIFALSMSPGAPRFLAGCFDWLGLSLLCLLYLL